MELMFCLGEKANTLYQEVIIQEEKLSTVKDIGQQKKEMLFRIRWSDKLIFEQRSERNKGMSSADIWGRTFQEGGLRL